MFDASCQEGHEAAGRQEGNPETGGKEVSLSNNSAPNGEGPDPSDRAFFALLVGLPFRTVESGALRSRRLTPEDALTVSSHLCATATLAALALAACSSSNKTSSSPIAPATETSAPSTTAEPRTTVAPSRPATVALASNAKRGKSILVDSKCLSSLYIWDNDTTPGKARCTGASIGGVAAARCQRHTHLPERSASRRSPDRTAKSTSPPTASRCTGSNAELVELAQTWATEVGRPLAAHDDIRRRFQSTQK